MALKWNYWVLKDSSALDSFNQTQPTAIICRWYVSFKILLSNPRIKQIIRTGDIYFESNNLDSDPDDFNDPEET